MDYDPLLAKLIGYGSDRDQTIGRLTRALGEYFVGGIKTNISLFRRILCDPDFRAAKIDTGFLDRLLMRKESTRAEPQTDPEPEEVAVIAAGIFAVLELAATEVGESAVSGSASSRNSKPASNWKRAAHRDAMR
jgi:acetyl-CoA carboxylase biotin carboxylase subunit